MTTDPAPVEVTNTVPMPVTVHENGDTTAQTTAKTVASSAKVDADILMTEGQRAINRLWERTQAIIAVSIVEVTLAVVGLLIVAPVIRGSADQAATTAAVTGLVLLSNLVGNVTGSYFTRTNHVKTGGVGGGGEHRGE